MYKSSSIVLIAIFLFSGFFIYFIPEITLLILFFNFFLTIAHAVIKIKLYKSKLPAVHSALSETIDEPFISIHIAICKEPVENVIMTIESAINQNYENYEIIVLYNNTEDSSYWKPIETFCRDLEKVHFHNYPNLQDYKAGALNKCIELMNSEGDYIFTLDADYILDVDALKIAINSIEMSNVSLLQFPQAYNNHETNNALATEFNHYFKAYSNYAGSLNENLPTGTLTLVRKHCLIALEGWPVHSITEDAYLGVELLQNKFKIGFCDKIIGRGLMPNNKRDLKTQRMRWIFGNFQTLIHSFKNCQFQLKTRAIITTQLTSWINFNGLAWIHIFLVSIFSPILNSNFKTWIILISLIIIAIHSITQVIMFSIKANSFYNIISGFFINAANSFEGAYAWWGYFFKKDRPFSRTNKFSQNIGFDFEQFVFNLLILVSGILLFSHQDKVLGVIVCLYSVFRMATRIYLHLSLLASQKFKIAA